MIKKSSLILCTLLLLSCGKPYHGTNAYKGIKLGNGCGVLNHIQSQDYSYYGFKDPPPFQFSIIPIQPFNIGSNVIMACLEDAKCFNFAKKMAKFGGWVEILNKTPGEYCFNETISLEDMDTGAVKIMLILNKNNQIIGIYPNKTIDDVDEIMKDFPQYSKPLAEFKNFKFLEELEEMLYEFQQATRLKPTSQNIHDLEKLRKMEEALKVYQLKTSD